MQTAPADPHRVLIVGGGFGGLYAARKLSRDERVDVTLVDRRNFHLFQPLLYQVATGALSPGRDRPAAALDLPQAPEHDGAARRGGRARSGQARGRHVRWRTDRLRLAHRRDRRAPLVLRARRVGEDAPGLKSIDDATEIRRRILIAFEAAEREAEPERRAEWMTFVVVGAGPTGAELAGALGEIAKDTLKRDFRSIDPTHSRIVLVEAMERVLPPYPKDRSASARRQLERLGVTVRTDTKVVGIDDRSVTVEVGTAEAERCPRAPSSGRPASRPRASPASSPRPPAPRRTETAGSSSGPTCRSRVIPRSSSSATPRSGAMAGPCRASPRGHPGRVVRRRRDPAPPRRRAHEPFRYRNRGEVAIIGRLSGVTDIPWLGPFGRQSGFIAWLLWLGIHIAYLIGFANRIVVLTRWAWWFVTHGRGSRLITGEPHLPPIEAPEPPA